MNTFMFNSDSIVNWRCYMKTKDTTMTIYIDDMLKKKAKVNALMSNMTLKEYIAYLIQKDCEGGVYNKKKVDR